MTETEDALVKYDLWLVLSAQGDAKLYKKTPPVPAGQRAMKICVEVPVSIFDAPQIEAKIVVGGDTSGIIQAEAIATIEEAVKGMKGVSVSISTSGKNPR